MFYAKNFIFDGITSEQMGLSLGELNGSGEATTSGGSDIEILSEKIFRKPVPYLYGVEQKPVLEFPLSVYSETEITAGGYSRISGVLFGQQSYKKLRIIQDDMSDVYFNCFLRSPQIIRIGNIIRGITFTVTCDAPWGWREPKTVSYNLQSLYPTSTLSDLQFYSIPTLYNDSANSYYTYPTNLALTLRSSGGTAHIMNVSDNSRRSTFTFTYPGNQTVYTFPITLNCELQTLSAPYVDFPLNYFNRKWLRLLKGKNILEITGNVREISITYPIAFKIG